MTDFTDETTVVDSSLYMDTDILNNYQGGDYGVRIGIVRDVVYGSNDKIKNDVVFMVDVHYQGREIVMGCQLITRFGGPHNFEEWTPRNWLKFPATMLHPSSADKHEYRAGDRVIVVALDGDFRSGVILGAMRHQSRKRLTPDGEIAYLSRFNGLETEIRQDGAYKVTYRGLPINDALLDVPPTGSEIPEPKFDPTVEGSFFGFDSKGSYSVSDGNGQLIKIVKDAVNGSIAIVSNGTRIDLNKDQAMITTPSFNVSSDSVLIKGSDEVYMEGKEISLKGKISIGNDAVELLDTLIKLVAEFGNVVVTSPNGTCTPINSSPNWAAIEQFKTQLEQIKGSGPQSVSPPSAPTDEDNFGDNLIT